MRHRALWAAFLHETVVNLSLTTVAAGAAVLAVAGPTPLALGLAALMLVAGTVAVTLKVHALCARDGDRQRAVRLMGAGARVLREHVLDSPGVRPSPGQALTPRPEDTAAVDAWVREATDFVTARHPDFLPWFLNDTNLLAQSLPGDRDGHFGVLREKVDFRLARLGELLRRL